MTESSARVVQAEFHWVRMLGYEESRKYGPYKSEYAVTLQDGQRAEKVTLLGRSDDAIARGLKLPTSDTVIETLQLCMRELLTRKNPHLQPVYEYLAVLPKNSFPKIIVWENAAQQTVKKEAAGSEIFHPASSLQIIDFISHNISRLTR